MKSVRLFLLCAFVVGASACERHSYSELEKLEHQGEFAKKTEGNSAEPKSQPTP